MSVESTIFTDIGLVIIMATMGGFIARFFKQPLISSYIIMGVLIGPVFGFIKDLAVMDVLSEIGIAFLLFIVGIELDLKRLKTVGAVASLGALIQMALSFVLGYSAFLIMGFSVIVSVYAGVAVMFSSTMVVIKVLSDRKQLDTLHGRIVIGTLLMQDVVAVMLLSILSHLDNFSAGILVVSIAKGALVFVAAWLFSKFLFPQLFKFAAKTQELFFLASISVCFLFSLAFVKIGFSVAIGAFVGGLMLGNLPYNLEIISKIKNLRDFFATLFFVSMGAKLTFATLSAYTWPFIVMLFATIVFLPFITFLTTMMFGFNRRVAFLTALSLSQISEFALIAIDQGLRLGHVDQGFLSLTIMTALSTIMITSYLVKYEDAVYARMKPFLKLFDKFSIQKHAYEHENVHVPHKVIIIGFDRIGYSVSKTLSRIEDDVFIVDFNPDIIDGLMKDKIPCMYGDVGDDEVLDKLYLEQVEILISTIPTLRDNLLLVKKIRRVNKDAKVVMTAYVVDDALELYDAGADYVILPHLLGGHHAGLVLENISQDLDSLILTRLNHINELRSHKARHRPHFFRDANL